MKSAVLVLALMPTLCWSQTQTRIAHEHGVGHLDIAISEGVFQFSLVVPAADIVGFEQPAQSDEDRALVAVAISDLSKPLELFVMPVEATCVTTAANVTLSADGLGPDGEATANPDQDQHSEFQAEYQIQCQSVAALTAIEFAYFDRFPNAQKLHVQIDRSGESLARQVTRSAPNLPL